MRKKEQCPSEVQTLLSFFFKFNLCLPLLRPVSSLACFTLQVYRNIQIATPLVQKSSITFDFYLQMLYSAREQHSYWMRNGTEPYIMS